MSLILPSTEIIRPSTVSRRDFLRVAGITTTVVLMGSPGILRAIQPNTESFESVYIVGDYIWFGNMNSIKADVIHRSEMRKPENQKRYRNAVQWMRKYTRI